MRKFFIGAVVFCSSLTLFAGATPNQSTESTGYLWPTDASRYLTSSFGEYRARRFHMGLDIKTWGKTGYKCFAIREGYIWRITVSPYGYGRAVYLKLDTGETAVYAHLQKFNDKIEKLVKAEQKRLKRYRINMFLKSNTVPVKQGDIIGYTGQTGIGAPHLHFEIRDKSNRPTNPLLKGYALPDKISPIVTRVSFSPLDFDSEVNGDYEPVIVSPQWVSPGKYEVGEPIIISGNVGIGVRTYDKASKMRHRFGVYSLKLYVDDILKFSYKYDRVNFKNNPMVELERDYRLSRRKHGRFYKLYKDNNNKRNIYSPNKIWGGVLKSISLNSRPELFTKSQSRSGRFESGSLFPGEHDFRIEVKDFFNNTTEISGKIRIGSAFEIRPVIKRNEQNDLVLNNIITNNLNQLQDLNAYQLSRTKWQPLNVEFTNFEIFNQERGGASRAENSMQPGSNILIGGQQPQSTTLLRLIGQDQFGIDSYPYFYVEKSNNSDLPVPELSINYDYYDDYVKLTIDTKNVLWGKPQAVLYPGRWDESKIEIHQTDLKKYIGKINLNKFNGKEHSLLLTVFDLNDEQHSFFEQFVAEKVDVGTKNRVSSEDEKCFVKFWSNSLFKPIYTRMETDSLTLIPGLKKVSNIYKIQPQDALLKGGAYVHIRYPKSSNPEKLGVYYKETRKDKWIYIDNQLDEASQTISAKVLSLEDFTLAIDDIAPEIKNLVPANGARLKDASPFISVSIKDKHSGIDSEKQLEMRLDGRKIIAEYDPERDRLFYRVEKPLLSGQHEILVMALDMCKNAAVKKSNFWID